jgi:transposase
MSEETFGVGPESQIPDALWLQIVRVLPPPKARKKDGRPRMDDRQAMTAILYVLRTGQTWPRPPLPGWGVKPAREPFTHPADSNKHVLWRICGLPMGMSCTRVSAVYSNG